MNEREVLVTFGRNLQHLMHQKEISFRELAAATGINFGSLNEYALAKRNIPLKYAHTLAVFFNKTVDDMLTPMEGSHVYQVKDKRADKRKEV
jgi:transcriptional regulator with XRE-family HTH domain